MASGTLDAVPVNPRDAAGVVPVDGEKRALVIGDAFRSYGSHQVPAGREPEPVLPDKDPVPTWDEIATKYGRKVYTIAYRLTGDPEEAKDLAQDVFVRVYRNLDKYEPGTFEGWLYRITKNLFLDRVRRKRRVLLEPLAEDDWRQPEEPGPGPEQRLEQGLLRGDVERALAQLPPDFRTAVVLCDIQDLSYEEIAKATGWPLGTVRSRIHRGRRLLRQHLQHLQSRPGGGPHA